MKITRPSLKRSGFVITRYGCRFGKVPFMIYRKKLYPLRSIEDPLFFELFGVDEITNGVIGKIQKYEKKADEMGIDLLEGVVENIF